MKTLHRRLRQGLIDSLSLNGAETASILKNIGWLFQGKLINYILLFVVGMYTIKRLGPENYGIFTYCYSLSSFFNTLVGFGLREIVIRELVKNADNRRVILGTAGAIMLMLGGFSYGLSVLTVYLLRPDDLYSRQLVALLSLSLLFVPLTVFSFYFDAQLQSRKTALTSNVSTLSTSTAKVVAATASINLYWYAIATLVENVVTGIGLLYLSAKQALLTGLRFDATLARTLVKASWPLAMSNLAIWLYMRIDQIMIRDLSNDFESGIYATAVRFVDALYFIPVIIQSSFLPKITRAHGESQAAFIRSLKDLYRLIVGVSYALILGFVCLIKPFITLFLGPRFEASADISLILIVTLLFVAIGVARSAYIYTLNLTHLLLRITLVSSLLNIGLNFILIPRYGALGAVLAILVTQIYSTLISSFVHKPLRETGRLAIRSLLLQG
jgi:PST family polysaccharide transporter